MVTSIPLVKTRCAASGSAQTLNSAAGVTLPSAIAPPHQDDAGDSALDPWALGEQKPDVRQRPHGNEDDPVVLLDLRGDEVDRVALPGFRLRVRQVGTVEA